MGTTLAIISLVGSVAALFLIETFVSGDKSGLYRAVMILGGLLALVALITSVAFSGGGVNVLGTVLSVIALALIVLFVVFGDSKTVEQPPSASDTDG